jgi:hypothetical protein
MGAKSEIQVISEPEAAAVHNLQAIQRNYLSTGDNLVVCDAGGGTVDMIAYKIITLKPLRVRIDGVQNPVLNLDSPMADMSSISSPPVSLVTKATTASDVSAVFPSVAIWNPHSPVSFSVDD